MRKPVVAILAGGLGTRLRPVISDVPKPLAPVNGKPFLFILLNKLASLGVSQVVMLTGYMHDKIVEACSDGADFGLRIRYSKEESPLGTAGALANAAPLFENESEIVLMNGDTYLDAELKDFITQPLRPDLMGRIGILACEDSARYGSVKLNKQHIIEAFNEKQAQSTGLINAGIYKLSTRIFDHIPTGVTVSLERDTFPKIIRECGKNGLEGLELHGKLTDIGTPESYHAFNQEQAI